MVSTVKLFKPAWFTIALTSKTSSETFEAPSNAGSPIVPRSASRNNSALNSIISDCAGIASVKTFSNALTRLSTLIFKVPSTKSLR